MVLRRKINREVSLYGHFASIPNAVLSKIESHPFVLCT